MNIDLLVSLLAKYLTRNAENWEEVNEIREALKRLEEERI